jgi:hypothetical protein
VQVIEHASHVLHPEGAALSGPEVRFRPPYGTDIGTGFADANVAGCSVQPVVPMQPVTSDTPPCILGATSDDWPRVKDIQRTNWCEAMKVFISWSGERSKAVAEVLDEWLQCVLQAIDPWMSSKDIDRGSLWFSELSNQLADTKLGIVCLTRENKTRPWILFEAGALAKGLTSARVCTFLIDLEPTDIDDPLAQFNHSRPDEGGVYDLLRTINSSLGDRALKEKVLERVFETYWPQFQAGFQKALEENSITGPVEERTDENVLREVLTSVRRLDRKMREFDTTLRKRRSGDLKYGPDLSRPRLSALQARFKIEEMMAHEMPLDLIVARLENDGVSPKVIEEMIADSLASRDANASDGTADD